MSRNRDRERERVKRGGGEGENDEKLEEYFCLLETDIFLNKTSLNLVNHFYLYVLSFNLDIR